MLDVRRLRTFLTAANVGSFTGAAKQLFMTHSAVSQQMAILEREVGLPLIERTARGIELTDAGRILADRCTMLFGVLATIESELDDLRSMNSCIRFGAFPTASASFIPWVLQEFTRRHPQVGIEFLPIHVGDITDRLRDGTIHVGLSWEYDVVPRTLGHDIEAVHLLDEPLDLLVAKSHPLANAASLTLAQVAGERWILRTHMPPFDRAFANICRTVGFEPEVIFTTDDYQAIHGFVGAGLGVSLVPRLSLQVRHPSVAAIPVAAPTFHRRILMLTLAQVSMTDPALKLFDVLRTAAVQFGSPDEIASPPTLNSAPARPAFVAIDTAAGEARPPSTATALPKPRVAPSRSKGIISRPPQWRQG